MLIVYFASPSYQLYCLFYVSNVSAVVVVVVMTSISLTVVVLWLLLMRL